MNGKKPFRYAKPILDNNGGLRIDLPSQARDLFGWRPGQYVAIEVHTGTEKLVIEMV